MERGLKAKLTRWRVADLTMWDLHLEVIAIDFSEAWTGEDGNLKEEFFTNHEFTGVDDTYNVDYMGVSSSPLCDDYGAQFNEG